MRNRQQIKNFLIFVIFVFTKTFYFIGIPIRRYLAWILTTIRMSLWKIHLGGLGEKTLIYPMVVIHFSEAVKIGSNVSIGEFVHMWGKGGIEIGDYTIIGAHSSITSQTHDTRAYIYGKTHIMKSVKIGSRVWIGSGAIILPGVRVGDGAIIGAGSVVVHDVAPDTIVTGVPAKLLRRKN